MSLVLVIYCNSERFCDVFYFELLLYDELCLVCVLWFDDLRVVKLAFFCVVC